MFSVCVCCLRIKTYCEESGEQLGYLNYLKKQCVCVCVCLKQLIKTAINELTETTVIGGDQ